MSRGEIDRWSYWLRAGVQQTVLIIVLFGASTVTEQLWVAMLMGVTVLSNLRLVKAVHDERDARRVRWLTVDWLTAMSLITFAPYSPTFILFIVLVVTASIGIDRFRLRTVFVMLSGLSPVFHQWYAGMFTWQTLLTFLLLMLFFLMFSVFFRQFEDQQLKLESLNEQLASFAAREKDFALEQERNRIARELHDTVAHQSTGLIVQLQKLKMAMSRGRHDEAEQACSESEEAARKMLDDMRQSVRMISPVEGAEDPFTELFSEFEARADIRITSSGIRLLQRLPLREQAGFYGLCQEALTNAKRHGHAGLVRFDVKLRGDMLHMRITDDGSGIKAGAEKGFGLRKMTEFIEGSGGTLSITGEAGTVLEILYPYREGESG